MKKLVTFFLAVLSCASTPLSYAQQDGISCYVPRAERRHRVMTAYVASLIMSGGIGAVTGGFWRYLEKKSNVEACPFALFVMLLGWALESELRNDIIIALQRDLDEYGITYRKGLMFKGSWIASWISYLHA